MTASPARPIPVGEIIAAAFAIYRRRFRTLAVCVLVLAVPLNVIATVATLSTDETAYDFSDDGPVAGEGAGFATGQAISGALGLVMLALGAAACLRAVMADLEGRGIDWRTSLAFALERLGSLLWLTVILGVALLFGFIALIVPGIWLGVAWSVAYPVLLMERTRPTAAMGRSFELVRGSWWYTFRAVLATIVLVVLIQLAVGGLVTATVLAGDGDRAFAAVMVTLANIVGYVLTLPLQAAVIALLYVELRRRKEGFELDVAEGIALPADGSAAHGPRDASDAPAPEPRVGTENSQWPEAPEERYGGFAPPRPPDR